MASDEATSAWQTRGPLFRLETFSCGGLHPGARGCDWLADAPPENAQSQRSRDPGRKESMATQHLVPRPSSFVLLRRLLLLSASADSSCSF